MKTQYILLTVLCLSGSGLFAQGGDQKDIDTRRDKLEMIMRFQDERTVHDGKLISFFTDPDPVVRERAVRSFGSIQDTSVITLLVDRLTFDNSSSVQAAAAFAIGQTAGSLSKKARAELEHDLIWERLERMPDATRGESGPLDILIEEIGKFGTEAGLNDLILRFGNVSPPQHAGALVMCSARFAVRGITTPEGVRFLLKFIKPAGAATPQVAYALQRIGNHQEIRAELEDVALLSKHGDPYVRMNLATLLGKVKDANICLLPLQKLADFDPDPRVRVNALKALGGYDLQGKDEIISTFRRSFYNENMNVALTAISAFGNAGISIQNPSPVLSEALEALGKIALNDGSGYLWQLQAEAATAIAKLKGKSALDLIKIRGDQRPLLRAQLLIALGLSGAPDAAGTLFSNIGSDKAVLYCSALEALKDLSRKNPAIGEIVNRTYQVCIGALSSGDVSVVASAASVLGDSLFLRPTSVEPLIQVLKDLRAPDDVESIQEIVSTLGKLRDQRAVEPLKQLINLHDLSVAGASASALKEILGKNYQPEKPEYFEPVFADYDFPYLRSFGDTVHVKAETIRGDIVMDLYKNYAPFTVMSFLKLATQRGFYRGLSFHRVVPNFVVQGGDPRGDGWGGPGYSIRSEFSPLTYETGTVGMASAGKDTEGSQFFIAESPQPHLDGRYTIFGKVVSGMDVVGRIQADDHIFDVKILP